MIKPSSHHVQELVWQRGWTLCWFF